jgi:hypothetical protein
MKSAFGAFLVFCWTREADDNGYGKWKETEREKSVVVP